MSERWTPASRKQHGRRITGAFPAHRRARRFLLAALDDPGDDGDDATDSNFKVAPGDHLGHAGATPIVATITVPKRTGRPKREKPPSAESPVAVQPIAPDEPIQAAANA